jgi:hypothetical protein
MLNFFDRRPVGDEANWLFWLCACRFWLSGKWIAGGYWVKSDTGPEYQYKQALA